MSGSNIILTRNLAGVEDLLLSSDSSQVNQTRNGVSIPITPINASNIPFSDTQSIEQRISSISSPTSQLLAVSDALSISDRTITLNKGDGTSETVDVPDTDLSSVVATNSVQALASTDAISISGRTITLNKGNGTSETVTVPETTIPAASNNSFGGLKVRLDGTTLHIRNDGNDA